LTYFSQNPLLSGNGYGEFKLAISSEYYISWVLKTLASVACCIVALLDHPEVLKKAQAEIDSVLKPGTLPDFDDEASLPYINAIVKESMRLRDILPLGMCQKSFKSSVRVADQCI